MERVNSIMQDLYNECKENNVSCLVVLGNKDSYSVAYTEDFNALGETLYFAFCDNEELLATTAESVRIASENVVNNED